MSADATSCGSDFHSVSDVRENENEDCELFKEGAGIGSKRFVGASSSVGISESVVALLVADVIFSPTLTVVVVVVVVIGVVVAVDCQ